LKYDKKAEAELVRKLIMQNPRVTPTELYNALGHGENRLTNYTKMTYIQRLGFRWMGTRYEEERNKEEQ
jgi:hypothetical protein